MSGNPLRIRELRINGYRSLLGFRVPIHQITVFAGPNASGKSNLYRAMRLLTAAARGEFARTLAEEGGLPSALWAGPRRRRTVRLSLGFSTEEWEYDFACGHPDPDQAAFPLDPAIKMETLAARTARRRVSMLERDRTFVQVRDSEGNRQAYPAVLNTRESCLAQIREPHQYPELAVLRDYLEGWRFYHHFRTDDDSPLRQPQVGVFTTRLSEDGRDLASALATIQSRPEDEGRLLARSLEEAFPGSALEILADRGRMSVRLHLPGLFRPMEALEISDGTLRYLALLAALLSPAPPPLIALNEPETSMHPDLLDPLARLISAAADRTQVWVVTHSRELAERIEAHSGSKVYHLEKVDGVTKVAGLRLEDWEAER